MTRQLSSVKPQPTSSVMIVSSSTSLFFIALKWKSDGVMVFPYKLLAGPNFSLDFSFLPFFLSSLRRLSRSFTMG